MRKSNVFAAVVVLAGLANVARGDVLANWTFETSEPPTATGATNGPWAAEVGIGTATGVHADVNGGWSSPAGNGSANSWNGNTWTQGDYFQFEVSTVDFEDISIAWDQTRSSTGPATWDLQYATSLAGPFTTFTDDYAVAVVTWSSTIPVGTTSFSADLSALASVEGAPTLYFRIVADSAPGSTAGASRLDNVVISGTPIPEPAAGLLAAGAAIALPCLRRRSPCTGSALTKTTREISPALPVHGPWHQAGSPPEPVGAGANGPSCEVVGYAGRAARTGIA